MKVTEYITTSEPMLLATRGEQKYYHLLPAGAALYKYQSFPEGHTTFIAYINIKGEFAHESTKSEYAVDPMWAFPVQRDEVSLLLSTTPVSKDDLVRILKARKMTRDELAQIVRDWEE